MNTVKELLYRDLTGEIIEAAYQVHIKESTIYFTFFCHPRERLPMPERLRAGRRGSSFEALMLDSSRLAGRE